MFSLTLEDNPFMSFHLILIKLLSNCGFALRVIVKLKGSASSRVYGALRPHWLMVLPSTNVICILRIIQKMVVIEVQD